MAKNVLIGDKVVPKSQTTVEFLSRAALDAPVPSFANWSFRIVAIITTVAFFWVDGTSLIQEAYKSEIMLGLKSIDMVVLLISKGFGIVKK